jgi:arylsulfate sulfotransferase
VSARQMSQVWKIDAHTGDLIWKLGYHGDFTFVNDPLGRFTGQHYVRETAPDRLLMFDDGNGHTPPQSRAVEYQLAFASLPDGGSSNTATLVWSYTPNPSIYAYAMGSAQRLSNGDTLVDFGTLSQVEEVDAQGDLVWQLKDTIRDDGIYRAQLIDSLY